LALGFEGQPVAFGPAVPVLPEVSHHPGDERTDVTALPGIVPESHDRGIAAAGCFAVTFADDPEVA